MQYQPEYPILKPSDMLPREQMRLAPERDLSAFDNAELHNLRRGVGHKFVIGDTPENRERIAVKVMYFQMVAYKDGWQFDPQMYQVRFIDPQSSVLRGQGSQTRMYQFEKGAKTEILGLPIRLSPKDNLGIEVSGKDVRIMEDEETDGLVKKVLREFFG